ncbi:MAG: ADP-ribose pyrophosphatase, partial [Candidatus Peregrinibacteria bacterium Greene0416_19]
ELFSGHGWRVTLEEAPLPDGRVKTSAHVHRADTAHILAFPTEDTILLLREFRPFYGCYIWMLPTGRIDKEADIAAGALRELQEETGFTAEEFAHYCTACHSETLQSANHIFIARHLTPNPLPQDADELIEVHELPLQKALENVLTSEHVHLASAFALLHYLHHQNAQV